MPNLKTSNPIFVALDTTDLTHAVDLAGALAGTVGGVKLGLEFFGAHGPDGIRAVAAQGMPIFLDLKFHDIPQTVAKAVRAVTPLAPVLMTIHTSGGPAMMRAAADAAAEAGPGRAAIVGVTVLTSLDAEDLDAVGQTPDPAGQVRRLAALARKSGLDGVVCSPHEAAALRAAEGPDFLLITPGVRPAGAAAGDQKRVMTPAQAIATGANILVIGRPITEAPDPVAAARAIAAELPATPRG